MNLHCQTVPAGGPPGLWRWIALIELIADRQRRTEGG